MGAVVPAASQQAEAFTLCDQDVTGYERDIDVGREDFSPGDLFIFTDKLQNPRTGKRAARLEGKATYMKVRRRDALFIADITTTFPNGKIRWYGSSWFRCFREGRSSSSRGNRKLPRCPGERRRRERPLSWEERPATDLQPGRLASVHVGAWTSGRRQARRRRPALLRARQGRLVTPPREGLRPSILESGCG